MAFQFGIPMYFSSKIELARYFLDIYFLAKPPKEPLVQRAKEALAYFLVYGYSSDKEKFLKECLSESINSGYVRVIVNMLKKNGYITLDKVTHKKILSEEMLYCKAQLFEENRRTFTIGFIQKKDEV